MKRGMMMTHQWNNLILYDGKCAVCHYAVQFILKRDVKRRFKFASLSGHIGQSILKQYDVPPTLNSLVLVENNQLYFESTAVLKICKHLKGMWKSLSIFLFIPKKWRDPLYHIIADNRYKWFGRNNSCFIPTMEEKNRFLDGL